MVVRRFHHSWSWSTTRVQFRAGDGRSDRGSKWYKLSIGWHRLGYGGSCLFSFKNIQKQGSSMHERRERVWSSAQRRHLEPGRGETARYHRMGKYKGFACITCKAFVCLYLLIFFVWEWLLLNLRCFPGRSTSLQNMRQAATSLPDSDTGLQDVLLILTRLRCFHVSHPNAAFMQAAKTHELSQLSNGTKRAERGACIFRQECVTLAISSCFHQPTSASAAIQKAHKKKKVKPYLKLMASVHLNMDYGVSVLGGSLSVMKVW